MDVLRYYLIDVARLSPPAAPNRKYEETETKVLELKLRIKYIAQDKGRSVVSAASLGICQDL